MRKECAAAAREAAEGAAHRVLDNGGSLPAALPKHWFQPNIVSVENTTNYITALAVWPPFLQLLQCKDLIELLTEVA